MAQFKVYGADRYTGSEVCIVVDAADEANAMRKANEQGLFVSAVERADNALPSNLVPCPDCGRQVSKLAAACPGCGRPSHTYQTSQVDDPLSLRRRARVKKSEQSKQLTLFVLAIIGFLFGAFMVSGENAGDSAKIVGIVLIGLAASCAVLLFGGLPGSIARSRGHPNAEAIRVCGWLGTLTFGIVWVVALVWAYTKPKQSP